MFYGIEAMTECSYCFRNAELLRKYTSLGLKEIAALFNNISYAAVTMIHKRVEKKRQEDRKFNAAICEIEETLNVKT